MTTKFEYGDYTIEVTSYTPFIPMAITGSGYGDADPAEQEGIEFDVYVGDELVADERSVSRKDYFEILDRFKMVVSDEPE